MDDVNFMSDASAHAEVITLNTPAKRKTNSGSAVLKQNLGENIVRHTLLVDKDVRGNFVKLARRRTAAKRTC